MKIGRGVLDEKAGHHTGTGARARENKPFAFLLLLPVVAGWEINLTKTNSVKPPDLRITQLSNKYKWDYLWLTSRKYFYQAVSSKPQGRISLLFKEIEVQIREAKEDKLFERALQQL